MRSVFLYEFISAGGCWSLGNEPPTGSLLAEGAAMRDALAADFAACDFVDEIHLLHDSRLPIPNIRKLRLHSVRSAEEEQTTLQMAAADADFTVVIAPDFASCLENRARSVTNAGGRLLSPNESFIRFAANKQKTAEYLAEKGISVPRGIAFEIALPTSIDGSLFPAVLKPVDGAGSTHVRLLESLAALSTCDLSVEKSWRLEKFQPGVAASVSYLAGPLGHVLLPACSQRLSTDGQFQYEGGSTPLPPNLAQRAATLAARAAAALPPTTGYVGIDIVLGPADNGRDDFVIEINPRLTTSYLGLRQACRQNLSEAMWRWALGGPIDLSFRTETIHFAPAQS